MFSLLVLITVGVTDGMPPGARGLSGRTSANCTNGVTCKLPVTLATLIVDCAMSMPMHAM